MPVISKLYLSSDSSWHWFIDIQRLLDVIFLFTFGQKEEIPSSHHLWLHSHSHTLHYNMSRNGCSKRVWAILTHTTWQIVTHAFNQSWETTFCHNISSCKCAKRNRIREKLFLFSVGSRVHNLVENSVQIIIRIDIYLFTSLISSEISVWVNCRHQKLWLKERNGKRERKKRSTKHFVNLK